MRIFFSHSSSDKPLLRELTGYLPRWIATWIDENELLLGAGLEDALHNAIDFESDYVVLFLRRSTIDSEWVRKEVDWALTKEATINRQVLLTVALEDVEEALVELGLNDRLYLSRPSRKNGARKSTEPSDDHSSGLCGLARSETYP